MHSNEIYWSSLRENGQKFSFLHASFERDKKTNWYIINKLNLNSVTELIQFLSCLSIRLLPYVIERRYGLAIWYSFASNGNRHNNQSFAIRRANQEWQQKHDPKEHECNINIRFSSPKSVAQLQVRAEKETWRKSNEAGKILIHLSCKSQGYRCKLSVIKEPNLV